MPQLVNDDGFDEESDSGRDVEIITDRKYTLECVGNDATNTLIEGLCDRDINVYLDEEGIICFDIRNITMRLLSKETWNGEDIGQVEHGGSSEFEIECKIDGYCPLNDVMGICLTKSETGKDILSDFLFYHLFLKGIIGSKFTINNCEKIYISFNDKLFFLSSVGSRETVSVAQYNICT